MKRYSNCPNPKSRAWDFPGIGHVALRLATLAELQSVDAVWGQQRRDSDTHGWEWARVYTDVKDCVYALGTDDEIVALFGTVAKNRDLAAGPTRRLDYFQIAPGRRGGGTARLAFAVFARATVDFGGVELVVGALPAEKVVKFYVQMGGQEGAPPDWQAPKGLAPIRFLPATLEEVAEYADALEEEA